MKLVAHPDPHVLEKALVERVAEARRADPFGRLLVLVPTVRLAQHVQHRLAGGLGACLGVDVLHHRALVLRILDERPGERLRPASPRVLGALLARVLGRMPANRLARFAEERPAALPALVEALTDLREARIGPDEARACLAGSADEPLAEVYAAWLAALRATAGLTDRAGLVEAALPGAAGHAARYRAVWHHGAYELVGVHLDLMRAIDETAPVTFLLPAEPGAPAWSYAERFARNHLLEQGGGIVRLPGPIAGPLGERLRDLYREEARPEPAPAGAVTVRHAQGARDEVAAAVHVALDAIERGTPATEVAIVGRTLAPYAAALEETLDGAGFAAGDAVNVAVEGGDPEGTGAAAGSGDADRDKASDRGRGGIPWTSTLGSPLRREPEVRDFLLLLRVVAEDFPRGATADLMRSPCLRWKAFHDGPRPPGETVEAWSRQVGIVSGLREWSEDLPQWAAAVDLPKDASEAEREAARERARDRVERAERIADGLEALAERVRPEARRWGAHADALESLVREVLPGCGDAPPPEGPASALLGLLDEMRDLEAGIGDDRSIPFAEMVEWLERAVDSSEMPARAADRGGLRVLDAMQARGLTFDRLLWIGFQAGLFPRPPREDPFLSDAGRRRLREATGRPLPVKAEGEEEEHLLLALLLGAARERIDVSWQRSDEEGRPRNPSLALREVARLVLGRPDAEGMSRAEEARVRSHPRDMLEDLERTAGLLSPAEDLLLLALRSAGDRRAEGAMLARCAGLAPGLAMLRATESLGPADLSYDGRVGAGLAAPPERISVSALEQLGRCPLQYFFRRRLDVHPLEEEAGPFELAQAETGRRVHRVLEAVYRTLREEGRFEAGDATALAERAGEILPGAWERETADLAARFRRRAPLLWGVEQERWLEAIGSFLREDLARIVAHGRRPAGFEVPREEPLRLGPGIDVRLGGRFDRVLESAAGPVVGDYKTSGDLKKRASPAEMLKGRKIQAPLYRLLAGGDAPVELLGVGPEYHGEGRRSDPGERYVEFAGFDDEKAERGFRETLRVLLECRQAGRFPMLREDGGHCTWCEYRRACRRNHPPTRHREDIAPDAADVRDLQHKTTQKGLVTLERVRGEGA